MANTVSKVCLGLALASAMSVWGETDVLAVGRDASAIAGSNGWGSANDPNSVETYWDNLQGAQLGYAMAATNPATGQPYTREETARMTYNTYMDIINNELGVGGSDDLATRNRDIDVMRSSNTRRIENLEARLGDPGVPRDEFNRGISRVAALAGLHPLDFEKHDKFTLATAVGRFKDKNSVALGAFYRPNRDSMISFGTTLGSDAAYNLGASFKFGSHDEYDLSPLEAKERIEQLEKEVADLKSLVKGLAAQK